ncbi:MAG: tryptophan synthase subunit alpha [bacterium]
MTERIANTFERLSKNKEKALVAYIMAGDPDMAKTHNYVNALIKGGADIIELGMPFSDPIADGPTIQKSAQRALQSRTNIPEIFRLVRDIRKTSNIPIVLMGYINPVFKYGFARFFKDAKECGVDGIILPDLPLEELSKIKDHAERCNIDVILLAAPTSDKKRLLELSKHTHGFLYYISMTGVTGSSKKLTEKAFDSIKWIKMHTEKPVVVGFGISTSEQAEHIARISDGVVVGSAFVRLIENNDDASEQIYKLAHTLKTSINKKPLNY